MMSALAVVGSTLNDGQSKAYQRIRQIIRSGSHIGAVLSAPAGSGKTYLTGALVRDLMTAGHKVAATAPTNVATGILGTKIPDAESMTTHSLLGMRLVKNDDGTMDIQPSGKSRVSEFSVIVIDECSMLDSRLYGPLMEQRGDAFLLFVGDPHQLPPVEQGLDRSPVFDDRRHAQVSLTEIVRQKADSSILALATAIRGHTGRFPMDRLGDYVDDKETHVIARNSMTAAWCEGSRILSWSNSTVQSCNARLHARFHPGAPEPFCPGERVILHEQHESRRGVRLHNSSEGVVTDIAPGVHPCWPDFPAWLVSLQMDDGTLAQEFFPQNVAQYKHQLGQAWAQHKLAKAAGDKVNAKRLSRYAWGLKESFIPLRLAYASTVHKAQGATLHTAIVDIGGLYRNQKNSEFSKLLYTAVTRPSNFLVLAM
ncbi:ATP-dependent DNA helicase [Acidithiobacillus sp.]|uniref:ATP-dependent DNA helicase n=1 Tax=Acidithiobacillus sp. TaxID=1872118 RepID=UPI003D0028C4